jgi:hypothetical protein
MLSADVLGRNSTFFMNYKRTVSSHRLNESVVMRYALDVRSIMSGQWDERRRYLRVLLVAALRLVSSIRFLVIGAGGFTLYGQDWDQKIMSQQ